VAEKTHQADLVATMEDQLDALSGSYETQFSAKPIMAIDVYEGIRHFANS
jgi:hypothetical protein